MVSSGVVATLLGAGPVMARRLLTLHWALAPLSEPGLNLKERHAALCLSHCLFSHWLILLLTQLWTGRLGRGTARNRFTKVNKQTGARSR